MRGDGNVFFYCKQSDECIHTYLYMLIICQQILSREVKGSLSKFHSKHTLPQTNVPDNTFRTCARKPVAFSIKQLMGRAGGMTYLDKVPDHTLHSL